MARQIDERVVQMQFDNKQFEAGVATTLSSLDKLREKLRLEGVSKGLTDLEKTANQIDLSGMEKAADTVTLKFNAMSVAAITAISNIVNRATDAGIQLVKSLSTDQIMAGFDKYTQKTEAVQTIMNATGKSIDEVTNSLDKLQWFTDETSYSYSDMVTNIARFTSQNVDLDVALSAMEGIALAAADAGVSTEKAGSAMDALSKSLGKGYVEYLRWGQLNTINFGTTKFRQVVMETAAQMGTLVESQGKYRTSMKGTEVTLENFGETLHEAWFTSDVLLASLNKYSQYADVLYEIGDAFDTTNEAMEYFGDLGMELAYKAFRAGQEAKTFTDAINATKDAVSSGWMETFEIIFGNYEESVELWSSFTDTLWDIFASGAKARNDLFREWKDMGGRDIALEAVANAWENILAVVEPVRKAIREIFPPKTPEGLLAFTKSLRDLTEQFHLSEEAANTLRVVIKALLLPFKVIVTAVKIAGALFVGLAVKAFQLVDAFLAMWSIGNPIADFFTKLLGAERAERMFAALNKIVERLGNAFRTMRDRAVAAFKSFTSGANSKLPTMLRKVYDILVPIANTILDHIVLGIEKIANFDYSKTINNVKTGLTTVIDKLKTLLSTIMPAGVNIREIFSKIGNAIKGAFSGDIFGWLKAQIEAVSPIFKALLDAFLTLIGRLSAAKILVFSFGVALVGMFFSISKAANSISGAFSGLGGIFQAFQDRIKPNKFAQISKAILILAGALIVLSLVDATKLKQATLAMIALMGGLVIIAGMMAAIQKWVLTGKKGEDLSKGLKNYGLALVAMATGILELSIALSIVAKLEGGVLKGLATITALMVALAIFSTLMADESEKISKGSLFILAFALGIRVLVSALEKIEKLDLSNTSRQMFTLVAVILAMAAVAKSAKDVKFGSAVGMLLMTVNILAFVAILKKLAAEDFPRILTGIVLMIPLMIVLKLLFKSISKANSDALKAGVGVLSMSLAMLLITEFIKRLATVSSQGVNNAIWAIGAIGVMFTAFTAVAKMNKDQVVAKLGKEFLALSLSMLILSAAIKVIGGFSKEEVIQGTAVVVALMGMFTLLVYLSKGVSEAKGAIISMGVVIGILVSAVMLLTLIDWNDLWHAAVSLGGVLLALGGSLRLIKDNSFKSVISNVLLIGAILTGLVYAFKQMDDINGENAILNAGAISIAVLALSGATKLIDNGDVNWKNAATNVVAVGAFTAGLVFAFEHLDNIDGANATQNAGAISLAVLSLSVATRLLSDKSTDWKGVLANAGSVAGFAMIMGIVFKRLNNIDGSNAIWIAGAIGLAVNALAIATKLLSDSDAKNAVGNAIAISVIAGTMALVFDLLRGVDGSNAITQALAIGLAVNALTLASNTLNAELDLDTAVNNAVGLIPLVVAIGAVLYCLKDLNGLNTIENVAGMLAGIYGLFGLVKWISESDLDAGSAAKAAAVIDAIIVVIGALFGVVGALDEFLFKGDIKKAIEEGIEILNLIAYGLGSFVSNIITGIIAGGLPNAAVSFAEFTDIIMPALDKLTDIKPESVEGIQKLAETMLILTSNELLGKINSLTGESGGLSAFGEELEDFAKPFSNFMSYLKGTGITDHDVEIAGNTAKLLAEFANNLPRRGGAWQDIIGNNQSLSSFAEGLADFAPVFKDYLTAISGVSVSDTDIQTATNSAKTLAEFASALPKEGGWMQTVFGESKSLADFATELNSFAKAFAQYYITLDAADFDSEFVEKSANAALAIAKFATAIPLAGGTWQDFAGEKNLDRFGWQLSEFAPWFVDYFNTLKEADVDFDFVERSAAAATAIAQFASIINPQGGVIQDIAGEKNLGDFGEQLKTFGRHFAKYYEYVEPIKLDVVDKATASAEALVGVANTFGENTKGWEWLNGKQDLSDFGSNLDDLGYGLKSYSDYLSKVSFEDMDAAVTSLDNLIDVCMRMNSDFEPNAVTNFAGTMQLVATEGITAFISTFTNIGEDLKTAAYDFVDDFTWYMQSEDCKDLLKETGEWLVNRVHFYMRNRIDDAGNEGIKRAANNFVEAFVGFIHDRADILMSAGKFIVDQVSFGIEKRSFEEGGPSDAVRELANTTINSAKAAFGINSPSKVFEEIGGYLVAGLNKGLTDNQSSLSAAVVSIGRNVLNAFRSFFGIHSPSVVMRDEVGRYLIMGLAEGITTDMSAEDAAQKKAQNIVSAFKTELDKFSLDISTSDLEFELWKALNPDASEADISEKNAEFLSKKLESQAEKVQLANAEYQATMQIFGESAEETQEAYNKYLQEQITMAGYAKELSDIMGTSSAEIGATWDDYVGFINENWDALTAAGHTAEEIRDMAKDATGYDPAKKMEAESVSSIQAIMDEYLSNVEIEIDEATAIAVESGLTSGAGSGVSSAADALGSYGGTAGEYLNNGFSEEIENMLAQYQEMMENGMDPANMDLDYSASLAGTVDGYLNTVNEYLDRGYEAVTGVFNKLFGKSEESGADTSNGWSAAFAERMKTVGATQVTDSVTLAINQITDAGPMLEASGESAADNVISGFTSTIEKKLSYIDRAARSMANAVKSAVNSELAIKSPSRVFMRIGGYVVEGLANGITNNTNLVDEAGATMADDTIYSVTSVVSRIRDMIESGLGGDPVIRPVVDMSDIEDSADEVDRIFGGKSFRMSRTVSLARSVANSRSELQNGSTSSAGGVTNNYTFNQTNTSPKALNASTIYRQTRNQFSQLKEATK